MISQNLIYIFDAPNTFILETIIAESIVQGYGGFAVPISEKLDHYSHSSI